MVGTEEELQNVKSVTSISFEDSTFFLEKKEYQGIYTPLHLVHLGNNHRILIKQSVRSVDLQCLDLIAFSLQMSRGK